MRRWNKDGKEGQPRFPHIFLSEQTNPNLYSKSKSYFLCNSNRISSPTKIIFPISKSHVCGRETLSDSWLASLASFGNPPIKLEFKIGHK